MLGALHAFSPYIINLWDYIITVLYIKNLSLWKVKCYSQCHTVTKSRTAGWDTLNEDSLKNSSKEVTKLMMTNFLQHLSMLREHQKSMVARCIPEGERWDKQWMCANNFSLQGVKPLFYKDRSVLFRVWSVNCCQSTVNKEFAPESHPATSLSALFCPADLLFFIGRLFGWRKRNIE